MPPSQPHEGIDPGPDDKDDPEEEYDDNQEGNDEYEYPDNGATNHHPDK